MESIVFAGIAAVLLGVIFYFAPLHLHVKGKLAVTASAVIIASLSLVIEALYGVIGGFAAMMLLTAAASLFLKDRRGLFEDQSVQLQDEVEDEKKLEANAAITEHASAGESSIHDEKNSQEEIDDLIASLENHGSERKEDAVDELDDMLEETEGSDNRREGPHHQDETERPIESVLEELSELDETESISRETGEQAEAGAGQFSSLETLDELTDEAGIDGIKLNEKDEIKEEPLPGNKQPGRLETILSEMEDV